VTAHALEGDRENCLSAGMNDYLTKPLHIAQLDAALNRAIRRRVPAERANVVLDPVCIAGLKELREPGQPDPLLELSDLFARESDACVQKMEAGSAAHDAVATARAAHSLKGSASNLGAHRLATTCASLEQSAKAADWPQVDKLIQDIKTHLGRVREALQAELAQP
jgi:HPt (histidine-containing phosphotransfer) domain-containing protein